MTNVLAAAVGMFIGMIMFMAGYDLATYRVVKALETIKEEKYIEDCINEIDDIEDEDFPRTLDGKFFSREMAVKNMSMKDGD